MALDATIEMLESPSGEKTAVVTLSGLMTLGTNLKTADQKIQSAISAGASNLVLDLTGVEYSDSAGLGMIVHMYGVTKSLGGQLRLCGVGPRVQSMLKLTTTDTFLTVDQDRSASLRALGLSA